MISKLFKKGFRTNIDLDYIDSDYTYGSSKRPYSTYLKNIEESIKLISSSDKLKRYTYNQPSISFIIMNKFYHDFLNNVNSVEFFSTIDDYIDNNGFTLISELNDYSVNKSVRIYDHTQDLYHLYKESCVDNYLHVYKDMDLFSARYLFFPEIGISSDLSLITPDYISSALNYNKGNKYSLLSCKNDAINAIGRFYMNTDRYYSTVTFNIINAINIFHSKFSDNYIDFDKLTIEKVNNFLFKNGTHELFDYIENYYFLAEIFYYAKNLNDDHIFKIIENPVFSDFKYCNKDFSLLMEIIYKVNNKEKC